MAVDPRQLVAGFLTLSMFVMVGNMIKRDHFDTIEVSLSDSTGVKVDVIKVEEQKITKISKVRTMPVKDTTNQVIKQCFVKPSPRSLLQSEGFVTFSFTSGPEYHISQVTDAVVIANYLGVTLVVPNIKGNELGLKRKFQDMYNLEKFTTSLDGIVKVVNELPAEFASKKPTIVRVQNRVSEDFIQKNIKPIFQTSNYIVHISIVFPSISLKKRENQNKDLELVACQAMFHSLELKTDLMDVAKRMVERLKALSMKNEGQFIAVDLRGDMISKRSCKIIRGGRKSCYDASEIAGFLKKLGFGEDSVIYLTETWWHDGLNPLKEVFPKIYTKDDIIPVEKKGQFLKSGNEELRRALDLHICSDSDIFVPAISGLFYGNVAGRRIVSGRTRILVPYQMTESSASESDFISSYVSRKTHLAYSCMC